MKLQITLALLLASGTMFAQSVNTLHPLIIGHSFVAQAPWTAYGVPATWARGFDSYTCPMISQILPYLVPAYTPTVVLVEGTNDVARGFTPEQTTECLAHQINWIQTYRPAARIAIANVAPMSEGNCDGDYREQIAAYNSAYAAIAASRGVGLIDISSAITQPDGWASLPFMDGSCLIHPGQPGIPNAGWAFFAGQVYSWITQNAPEHRLSRRR